MTNGDFGRGRDWEMGWPNQGNDFRNASGAGAPFNQQGPYTGQGFAGQQQFGSPMRGRYGAGFGGEGAGWQPGQPQGYRFSGESPFGGWEGGYGPGGQMSQGYGGPPVGGSGMTDRDDAWRHGHSHEPWEHGHSGRGFWGQGHPIESQQGFVAQPPWGSGQTGQGQFSGQGYVSRGAPVGFVYEEFWLISGPHSGRGPRGYQRSDARIEEDICERLTQHGYLDASDVQVSVKDGEVTLTGQVESRQTKRLAEDIIDSVSGVKDVHNQLRVQHGGQTGWNQAEKETTRGKSGTQAGRNEKAMAGSTSS